MLNHSQTFTHGGQSIFEGYFVEAHHYWSERLENRYAAAWSDDFATNTQNITLIADLLFNVTSFKQLHFNYQHQHIKNNIDLSEFDTEMLMVEFSNSPLYSLALVSEYTNKHQLRSIEYADLETHR